VIEILVYFGVRYEIDRHFNEKPLPLELLLLYLLEELVVVSAVVVLGLDAVLALSDSGPMLSGRLGDPKVLNHQFKHTSYQIIGLFERNCDALFIIFQNIAFTV
jgi:hypothetical protein